jgi:uncharacterized protein YndB with AHSA1/START domain
MMDAPTIAIEREIRIQARQELVFELLTDATQLLRWQGVEAELDPRPGGIYRVMLNTLGHTTAGRYLEVVPHSRIVFTWGWDPPIFPIPPGSTTVEITLTPEGDATVLHLRHSGLPNVREVAESHADGWMRNLERLVMLAEGRELPPDPGRDGNMESRSGSTA